MTRALTALGGMTNPMTTAADLIVGGSSGTPTRLAKGSDGQVLTVDPTTHLLVWATPSTGFSDPTTTKGDLIVHGASTTRLAVGSNGKVLTANSSATNGVDWETPATGVSVTTKGDLQGYDSAANRIPIGSDNQFLRALASQTLGLKWDTLAASDIPSLAASKITSGQLAQAQGGTGKDTSGATDGQVLIGKTSDHSLNLATLSAGTGISITNGAGTVTVTANGAAAATLSTASAFLAADVTMTSANTFYDGPTLSLGAGTWLILSGVAITSASDIQITGKIWDGTTTASAGYTQNSQGEPTMTLVAIVTPSGTTTYKTSYAAASASSNKILAAPRTNSPGNKATWIYAIQIG